jgi:GAF domain-containing protein
MRSGRKNASATASAKKRDAKAHGLIQEARPKKPANRDEVAALRHELAEGHQREAATAEVLKTISRSSFDLQAVLDTLIESAAKLCEAEAAAIARQFASVYKPVATYGQAGDDKAFSARTTIRPTRGSALGRAVIDCRAAHIADVLADPEYDSWENQRSLGFRTILAVPLLRERMPIGVIILIRKTVRPFTEKQIELVTTFADQAVIAIENARLLNELQQRTDDLTVALEHQTATSEILSSISGSITDTKPVFEAIVRNLRRLFGTRFAMVQLLHNGMVHLAAAGDEAEFETLTRQYPRPLDQNSGGGLAMLSKRVVQFAPVLTDPTAPPTTRRFALELGFNSVIFAPMIREDKVIGAVGTARPSSERFNDRQVALIKTFADQAVIAIENVRLFDEVQTRTKELTESLEQQTATSEVLQVISSSPGELEPVFGTMLANAKRICEAKFSNLFLCEGTAFRAVAWHGDPGYVASLRREPLVDTRDNPESPLARLYETKQIVHVADLRTELAYKAGFVPLAMLVDRGGARTLLIMPMLKEGELVGAISIYRQEVRPFTDKQIDLVRNFAKQAVIAIENTRLLNELRESLQQQTATSEVLQVISSSPGELGPVFEAMLANATQLCEANFGNLFLYKDDGLRVVASHNVPPAFAEARRRGPFYPPPGSGIWEAIATKQTVHLADLAAARSYLERHPAAVEAVELGGVRTFLAVPMLRDSELVGMIVIYRQEVRLFTTKQIELVTNFARQAIIAIENVRLLNELRARTTDLARSVEELRALGDVSQAVNSTLNLATVLDTIVAKAVQLSDTEAGAIYEFDEQRKELQLRSTYGMTDELINALSNQHIGLDEPTVQRSFTNREPVQIPNLGDVPSTPAQDIVARAGYRALLFVPMLSPDGVVGALVVRRTRPGEFSPNIIDLLKTFSAQSVLAIQNAHLFTEIDDKSRQLEIASQHKSQFLANMSHELRTPLNAILGYTELILDNIYGETPDKMREVLERLQANGKHLLGLINDVLDLSKIEAGQLTLDLADYSLGDVVHTVVTAVESLAAGKKLSLTTVVGLNLPVGHGDERRLAQVLLNLVGNAIKFTDKGEVAINATAENGSFTVAVRDTGPGISASDQGKIFEEFQQADDSATKRKGGTGLGLSIARRIIGMHGGRIWVESDVGKGSTFAFTIPVRVERQASEP